MKKILFLICLSAVAVCCFAQMPVILLDAGHGGKDTGAQTFYMQNGKKIPLKEKDITLKLAKKTEEQIKRKLPDLKVFLTRTGDTYVSLAERAEKAEKLSAVCISFHVNSSFKESANGFTFYVSLSGSNTALAEALSRSFDKAVGKSMKNLGIKNLDKGNPFIVADIGFLSNKKDAESLADEDFILKCGESFADGIKAYLEKRKDNSAL